MADIAKADTTKGDVIHTTPNYTVYRDDRTTTIYPTLPNGKRIKVTMPRYVLTVQHHKGHSIEFTRLKTAGKWYLKDSRDANSKAKHTNKGTIVSEIARMICEGNVAKATQLVATALFT